VVLGVALWLQALACAYYGIFAGLMVGLGSLIVAGTRGLWRSREYWLAIGLAGFVSVALTFPFFLPYLEVQQATGFARTLDDSRMYSADAGAWLASSAWAHRWWLPWIEPFNEVLFPGIVSLVLGIAGFVIALRSRPDRELVLFYGLSAVLAFWLSFGPEAGLYTAFYKTIPVFSFLRAPGRIGIVVVMCLAVFAGVAVRTMLSQRPRAGVWAALIALSAAAELMQAPLTAMREAQPFPAAYRTLAVQPAGVVAEFPYFYQRGDFPRHAIYMLNSTTHWMPLVNGYSDHIPQEFRDQVVPLSSFPTRESFQILGKVGTRYVLFHLDMYDARSRQRLIERIGTYGAYLRPLVQEGDVWLFEIVGFPN
jgi:type II secretory pathway pseudopilin PulG